MNIILNSDIIFHRRLVTDKLSKPLETLFEICAREGYVIMIPETALLEFNRSQIEEVDNAIKQIKSVCNLFDHYKISYTPIDHAKIITPPNLINLIRGFGVKIMVEVPTIEDFKEAHKRACMHDSPHPPDAKSDEMRDLVIWIISLRIASKSGGALLISRDEVHSHSRGDEEAKTAKLTRVKSIDEALIFLKNETPASRQIRDLLTPLWENLLEKGVPLDSKMTLLGVTGVRFLRNIKGLSLVSFVMEAKASDGEILTASVAIHIENGYIREIQLSDITKKDKPWSPTEISIPVEKPASIASVDYEGRLNALKKILGE